MDIKNPTIKKLLPLYKEISTIGRIKALLDWDMQVNMPIKGGPGRTEQTTYLMDRLTKLWHQSEFKTLLEKAQTEKELSKEEKAMVRNLNRAADFFYKVPPEVLLKKEEVTSKAFLAWREAREENDFQKFLPFLSQIVDLNRTIAEHLGYKETGYDALLDLHEPDLTASFTAATFAKVRPALTELMKKVQKSKKYPKDTGLFSNDHHYPVPEQRKIGTFAVSKMGYDLQAGRIDVAPHPFTIEVGAGDVRVTTNYKEHDFRESYTSTMHEAGHALYEQGINPAYYGTPVEGGVSYGIHEALSRFWENMVGKNPNFLSFMAPVFQNAYAKELGSLSTADIILLFNIVKPSFIRIEADEVTYSLHIILRFEMENALMKGDITAKDASEAWREKSKEYLGIVPEKDSQGVLQDVHWAYGEFGYFPSYALGNLYGAQLLHTMKQQLDFDGELSKGNLSEVKTWLDKNVHTYGSLYLPAELIKKVTGEPLNPQYFIDYLREKYTKLYSL